MFVCVCVRARVCVHVCVVCERASARVVCVRVCIRACVFAYVTALCLHNYFTIFPPFLVSADVFKYNGNISRRSQLS